MAHGLGKAHLITSVAEKDLRKFVVWDTLAGEEQVISIYKTMSSRQLTSTCSNIHLLYCTSYRCDAALDGEDCYEPTHFSLQPSYLNDLRKQHHTDAVKCDCELSCPSKDVVLASKSTLETGGSALLEKGPNSTVLTPPVSLRRHL